MFARWCRLNAPYGARCFLTPNLRRTFFQGRLSRLNAPFGARCFLPHRDSQRNEGRLARVLMHLLVLGAF